MLTPERLRDIVTELASRPGHEKARSLVYQLLVDGLDASSTEIDFERPVPEVHGRIDALLGRTVLEFKSDLRREKADAESKLPGYLSQREKETGQHFVGIATDGATFIPYELRGDALRQLSAYATANDDPRALLAWLSSAVSVSADLPPTPDTVRRELGRDSLAWQVAWHELAAAWTEVGGQPDVRTKRELWSQLMERVYGSAVGADALFFQHTYLTTVAKTMATHVLGIDVPEAGALLAGRPLQDAGIGGAVESDFFDWLLASARGRDLVSRIALQAGRFRLRDVQTDVLKGLYESLVDPEQRHDLGEYYTPDWLAERMCNRAIEHPLEQRVVDPACGSGTFLFHAVRRLLAAADLAGLSPRESIDRACRNVFGVDVHPVAVQIARVTYLLALGPERLRHRPTSLTVPVYLGDSLQWNTRGFLAEREVLIEVPGGGPLLEFPFEVARDPATFDAVIGRMLDLSRQGAGSDGLRTWLESAYDLDPSTTDRLLATYDALRQLHADGRDHIWGFVARNLARPVWLTQPDQRADVVIGNPPWLSYRYMEKETQRRFREECEERGLWMGQVAQQQDLSAYFFVRSTELYLKPSGVIAFVMPYAAMSRRQFQGFRTGTYGRRKSRKLEQYFLALHFTEAWAFSDKVQPLFPVPSCVLFARPRPPQGSVLPSTIQAASGTLPHRDATLAQADQRLAWQETKWPEQRKGRGTGSYSDAFRAGAVVFPRVLFTVQRVEGGFLGPNPSAPVVTSRRTNLEKAPWKGVPPLRHNVELQFLRPLYLGESIAPFRLLNPVEAVIPWRDESGGLLDADRAQRQGYMYLSGWLAQAEAAWAQFGKGRRTLTEQLDYYGQLSAQFPPPPLRVVYSASGTLPAAALLTDSQAIAEHKLYWAPAVSRTEGRYLIAILNSETTRKQAERLQSRGQWGARDFDKVMLSLPIPRYAGSSPLHQRLVRAAARAEEIAAAVPLKEGIHFVKARQLIRRALQEDGVAQRIDGLVGELLGVPAPHEASG